MLFNTYYFCHTKSIIIALILQEYFKPECETDENITFGSLSLNITHMFVKYSI
jgi:hypothetical protein